MLPFRVFAKVQRRIVSQLSYPVFSFLVTRHSRPSGYPFSFQSLFVHSFLSSSNGAPNIPFIILPLSTLSFATDGVPPSFPQSVLCEGPPFHLWPLLSNACALFCAMEPTQHFSFQSLAHSFHRNGGVHPIACPRRRAPGEGRESRVRSERPKGGKRQAARPRCASSSGAGGAGIALAKLAARGEGRYTVYPCQKRFA
jgi:hypothetical protein